MDDPRTERIRTKFSRHVYFAFVFFLAIAVLQWVAISTIPGARGLMGHFVLCCPIAFCLAGILFCLFAFIRFLRSHKIVKWVVAVAIVELYVVAMFVLATASWLPELLVYFILCLVAMIVALVIGCNLSFSMDMTENIAPIFIACFLMAAASMYALMWHLLVVDHGEPYAFAAFELIISLMMLLLVMLHAQTIRGDRFIQMSIDDFLLAALLLFHEFLAMYAMTFYWQFNFAFFTSNDFFWMSTSTPLEEIFTPSKQADMGPPDIDVDSDYRMDFNNYDWSS